MNDTTTTYLSKPLEQDQLSAEQVVEHLKNNLDFFENNSQLLPELSIPHETGQSISLIERQVNALRSENHLIKQQLSTLINNAMKNDQLYEKAKALTLALIDSRSIEQIRTKVESTIVAEFGSQACRLWRISDNPASHDGHIPRSIANTMLSRLVELDRSYCGIIKNQESQLLFSEQANNIGSAAITPLYDGQQLIAILAIASQDENYFRENKSTTLLTYISKVITQLMLRTLNDPQPVSQ